MKGKRPSAAQAEPESQWNAGCKELIRDAVVGQLVKSLLRTRVLKADHLLAVPWFHGWFTGQLGLRAHLLWAQCTVSFELCCLVCCAYRSQRISLKSHVNVTQSVYWSQSCSSRDHALKALSFLFYENRASKGYWVKLKCLSKHFKSNILIYFVNWYRKQLFA